MIQPPHPLPPIRHDRRADLRHYTPWTGATPRPIRAVCLHNTEGANSLAWLTSDPHPQSEQSAHTLAARDGTLWELVAPQDLAHHAGIALPPYTNRTTLGIEFENRSRDLAPTRVEVYPLAQIHAGAYRVATWMFAFGLTWRQVVRHGDIALPRGRRCDPSAFPQPLFQASVNTWLAFFQALPPEAHAAWIR